MSEYFTYYLESNLVCTIIFIILLVRDLIGGDRQEKQIKFDHALTAFILYFVFDAVTAAVIAGVIPKTTLSVVATNFVGYLLMAGITYMWLRFAKAYEHVPHRDRKLNKFAILFPFILATFALVGVYIFVPEVLIDENLEGTLAFKIFLVAVPIIYIIANLIYTIKKAKTEPNREYKKNHIYIGAFPLMVVVGGIVQVTLLPKTPVFCFCCTILMLILYIQSMEKQISVDPLTGLNNRGQLMRYISQEVNGGRKDRRKTFVVMIDANDFKSINDTYGHAEGDRALVLIADALKKVTKECTLPSFLGRYGGDEFVIIINPHSARELEPILKSIHEEIAAKCAQEGTPYTLAVGIGCDEYLGGQDTIQNCMQRADFKLYLDKQYSKLNAPTQAD